VQATFLDAIEQRQRWDHARPLRPWLVGILVNHARIDRRRRARRIDPTRLGTGERPSPADVLSGDEVVSRVTAAVDALPTHLRPALTLRLLHGLAPAQIANALGCPVATVKTHLQRGLALLRSKLPAGLATGLALALAGPGLAAARAAMLRAADQLPRPVEVGFGVLAAGGGIAMKKTLIAALSTVLVAFLLWLGADLVPPPPLEQEDAASNPVVAQGAIESDRQTDVLRIEADRGRSAPDAANGPPTTGSIELRFHWIGTELPASRIMFWVLPKGDGPRPMQRCHADVLGRATLSEQPAGEYEVRSVSAVFGFVTVRAGQHVVERVAARPLLAIDGVVVDEQGRGIGAAEVFVQSFLTSEDLRPRRVAVTAEDGSFRARADRGGACWAAHAGFASDRLVDLQPDLAGPLRLTVRRATAGLCGTVLAAGITSPTAIELRIVRTQPVDEAAAPVVVRPDADGHFATDELFAGSFLLTASGPDTAVTAMAFELGEGECRQLVVPIGAGATLAGRVVDEDGAPLRA
ncbi:MAG: hypothetical protein KDC98_06245, partial [Planctomycetes bacterium]|nr:hypothetical protein [Planctomycetota bacterium]